MFTTDDGSPIFPTTPTWWLSKFCERIGIEHISLRSLRHTYASLMIADDVPIVEVSKQLGYARTSTTTNIYGHAIPFSCAKGLKTFDKFDDLIIPPSVKKQ